MPKYTVFTSADGVAQSPRIHECDADRVVAADGFVTFSEGDVVIAVFPAARLDRVEAEGKVTPPRARK